MHHIRTIWTFFLLQTSPLTFLHAVTLQRVIRFTEGFDDKTCLKQLMMKIIFLCQVISQIFHKYTFCMSMTVAATLWTATVCSWHSRVAMTTRQWLFAECKSLSSYSSLCVAQYKKVYTVNIKYNKLYPKLTIHFFRGESINHWKNWYNVPKSY